MTLVEIKCAIERLTDERRTELASWIASSDRQLWDDQIAKDFSPGGAGADLLKEVGVQIDHGNFTELG